MQTVSKASSAPDPPIREVPSQAPSLPASLAGRLAGYSWGRNLVGEAGAAVYRVHRQGAADLYLKHGSGAVATALADEMVRLHWLGEVLPVAGLEHFESSAGEAWLLTQALAGRTAYQVLSDEPQSATVVVTALASFMRQLHALPVEQCPFNAHHSLRLAQARCRLDAGLIDTSDFDAARQDWTPDEVWQRMTSMLPLAPDAVVSHGDFSLDNILLSAQGQVSGVIDLCRLGVADRYQDLAILWNCLGEFGPELQSGLFAAYGLTSVDEGKLEFHLCLDECF